MKISTNKGPFDHHPPNRKIKSYARRRSTHVFVDCFVKNHDLSVEEMLDFGIRYFDFDVKLCSDNILYTGHGKKNLYIRFGKVKDIMEHIHSWMKEHESEIIVVRFGQLLGSRIDGLKELKRILTSTFTTVGKNYIFNKILIKKVIVAKPSNLVI